MTPLQPVVPLSSPDITDSEIDAVVSVLRSARLSLGPRMEAFESSVAEYVRMPHAVAVSSGTAGLHLSLLALGIGEGDEVIVPSFAFIAAANVIRYVRGTPVFVDIERSTLNMSPAAVEAAITSRTRALMVVHTFGVPADLDALLDIARRHKLLVIEDACEALGAEYRGQPVGSFGDAAVFAFYPNKQITTGEGGMIVTRNSSLARELRALRNQGRFDSDDWLQHSVLGYNYRLSELHCALGCAQMSRLPEILGRRRAVAQMYARELTDSPLLVLPLKDPPHARTSWFVYVVRLQTEAPLSRDAVIARMHQRGIQCGRYFAPIHRQPAYAVMQPHASLPETEAVSLQTIALPFFTNLRESTITFVAQSLLAIAKGDA